MEEAHQDAVLDILFAETTTIGVRICLMGRWKLEREKIVVKTLYGSMSVKVARRGERVLNVAPEHRECQRIAVQFRAMTLRALVRGDALDHWR